MTRASNDEASILAYLRHKAGERRAAYVAQGRRFQALSNEAVESGWADAFVAMCLHGEEARVQELDDLSAELGLRGRPVPAHRVQHVMPDIEARARDAGPPSLLGTFARRVRAFLREQAET
jgi:hypothetical protein